MREREREREGGSEGEREGERERERMSAYARVLVCSFVFSVCLGV